MKITKMQHYILSLLAVVSLLHITASTVVYYVMPDNHYQPINDNAHTLQHYLNNTSKYFTSNTQLHFLPGQYYLNNNIIIQGVSNFSITGNRTSEVINTVINCTSPAGIVVVNSSNITIANILMYECGNVYDSFKIDSISSRYLISLFVLNCTSFIGTYFHSKCHQKPCGLILANVRENTTLKNIISSYLLVYHTGNGEVSTTHLLNIDNSQVYNGIENEHAIEIRHTNVSYKIKLTNTIFTTILALFIKCTDCSSHSTTISNCSFIGHHETSSSYDEDSFSCDNEDYSTYMYSGDYTRSVSDNFPDSPANSRFTKIFGEYKSNRYRKQNQLEIINCNFINNSYPSTLIEVNKLGKLSHVSVNMENCTFYNNHYVQILSVIYYNSYDQHVSIHSAENSGDGFTDYYTLSLLMQNVIISFHKRKEYGGLIFAHQTSLIMNNITVHDNQVRNIIQIQYCELKFLNYNEFLRNLICSVVIDMIESLTFIQENCTLNFTSNHLTNVFYVQSNTDEITMCAIQYISLRGNLDTEFNTGIKLNYSIVFNKNHMSTISNTYLMHCSWHPLSAFQVTSPLHINRNFIINDNSTTMQQEKQICVCTNNSFSCYLEEMGSIFPGQVLSFQLISTVLFVKAVLIEILNNPYITCKGNKSTIQLNSRNCTKVDYIIKHVNGRWCELSLKVEAVDIFHPNFNRKWIEMYTITLKPCPKGFSLWLEGSCQCDPTLTSYIPSITSCNIDDQTILHPANIWISVHTINNSHFYNVSIHCPFDYCLPHSSHLNLSTPDSQCQFHRSGVLCGQCQQGLSAVFSSSQCKRCSNVYLLIIIPIGIAGVVLVLMLFVLNLTVTDGSINGFLFYVNIININTSLFLPTSRSVEFTFVALTNLDLGIETCFYDGMDEYAKLWLKLAFPMYLIFIATSLIIASRYSARIQRLTARRALPVLATLFLLSYTKVLLTVSNVLFFYSTIISLPSNDTTLVWSVDANVSLFGIKFTVLFTSCLVLFLVLIPFNMLLIFTRTLLRFRAINYFKPILDAYQGPYKIKFYYWTGLQLLLRTIFFGLSALDTNTNLMLSIILLGAFIWLNEKLGPFKSKMNMIIEMLFLSNLFVMFAISILQYSIVQNIAVTILISLAMFKFACVVVLHVKILLVETFPKCRTALDYSKLPLQLSKNFPVLGRFTDTEKPRHNLELVNAVPEKAYNTYNYKDFQEPLIAIGED